MPRRIAFDVETYPIGLVSHPDSSSDRPKANRNPCPRVVCLAAVEDDESSPFIFKGGDAVDVWLDWIRDDDVVLIGHNIAFDMAAMVRATAEERELDVVDEVLDKYKNGQRSNRTGLVSDTLIRERLIDVATRGNLNRGYSLDALERRHLDRDRSEQKHGSDSWRTRYHHLDDVPLDAWPSDAIEYAVQDAAGTLDVWLEQQKPETVEVRGEHVQIATPDGVLNESFQTATDFYFQLVSIWGFALDAEKIEDLGSYYRRRVSELRADLSIYGLYEDGSKNQDMIRNLYAEGFESIGVDPPKTDTGKISTDKYARQTLRDEGFDDERFDLLENYTRAEKFVSTYIEPLEAAWPYGISPEYRTVVRSGRSSSRRPNVQTIPAHGDGRGPELRECFVPRGDHVFVGADYSSLELCTLAQVCLNFGLRSELATAINRGKDCHLLVAASLLERPYEDVVDAYESPDHEDHDLVKEHRQTSKIANYGFPTGMGARTFVDHAAGRGQSLTLEQSKRVRSAWLEAWPGVREYFQDVIPRMNEYEGNRHEEYFVRQHGPEGRRKGWRVRRCFEFCAAANSLFQGLAADGAKNALRMLLRECYAEQDSPLYGYRVCAFIHDEFILEGPRDGATAAADRLSDLMETGMELFTPDVEITAEPELAARWSKDAKPKRDEDGNLLVWGDDFE